MVIAKTASRNIAAKEGKVSEAVLDAQASFVKKNSPINMLYTKKNDETNDYMLSAEIKSISENVAKPRRT